MLDGVYLSAALNKVPDGGWFAIVLSFLLSTVFILWRWGKEQQWQAETKDNIEPNELIFISRNNSIAASGSDSSSSVRLRLRPEFGGGNLSTVPGLGVFFDKVGGTADDHIPKVFTQFVRKFQTRPRVVVFFHMRSLSLPTVPRDHRFVINRVTSKIPSCYRITLRHGYMDDVLTPNLAHRIEAELTEFITRGNPAAHPDLLPPHERHELEALREAQDTQTTCLMGKQTMRVQKRPHRTLRNLVRRGVLEAFLWIRDNTRTKLANLDIDPDNIVEVGFVKEI